MGSRRQREAGTTDRPASVARDRRPGPDVPTVRFTTTDHVNLVGDLADARDAVGVAVVCHPLTLNGGSMTSGLVPLVQRALVHRGWTTLRFDFRGAGRSEGRFDRGVGELHDLAAAVQEVRTHAEGPLLLTGWSFGAAISLRYAIDHPGAAGWLGIGLPLGLEELGIPQVSAVDLQGAPFPACFVHGTADDVAPLYRVRALAELVPTSELVAIDGGDHFLQTHRSEVEEAVGAFADHVAGR